MFPSLAQGLLGIASGALVGFSLGLVGGGGSILAVPLLIYLVGVGDPHVAIGTSAIAVAASALVNLLHHGRAGHVKWKCASVFAAAGIAGALLGSTIGKWMDGRKLLVAFAVLMLVVAVLMLRKRSSIGKHDVALSRENLPRLLVTGLGAGGLSGFFGIGGGFLIVPGLMLATRMSILNAVGSSLVGVTAFGVTTAANYALSGLVDWTLAAAFVAGGAVGGLIGAAAARTLATKSGGLHVAFATMIAVVACYMLVRTLGIAPSA